MIKKIVHNFKITLFLYYNLIKILELNSILKDYSLNYIIYRNKFCN